MTEAKTWVMSEEFMASFFGHKICQHPLVLPEEEIQPFIKTFEKVARRHAPWHLVPNPINDPKVKILAWVWHNLDKDQRTEITAKYHDALALSLDFYEIVKVNTKVFENMSNASVDNEHWIVRLYARTIHDVDLIDVAMPDQEKVLQLVLGKTLGSGHE